MAARPARTSALRGSGPATATATTGDEHRGLRGRQDGAAASATPPGSQAPKMPLFFAPLVSWPPLPPVP